MHTKEPWIIVDESSNGVIETEEAIAIISEDDWHICAVWRDAGIFLEESHAEANARRIVACVNACAGVPTKVLENEVVELGDKHPWKLINAARIQAEQQRDELLAALKEVTQCLYAQITGSGGFAVEEVIDDANAAISKAEGLTR